MKTLYTILERVKMLRNHLADHMDVAPQWRSSARAHDGTQCLYLITVPDRSDCVMSMDSETHIKTLEALGFTEGADVIRATSNPIGLLKIFNRCIARLEKQETPPTPPQEPKEDPTPTEEPAETTAELVCA